MVHPEHIPEPLKARDQWICWRTDDRNGTPAKVPIDPVAATYASVSDPKTWTTYRDAYTHYDRTEDVDGIGYVFHEDSPYAGVDIDDARYPKTGMLEEWVIDVLLTLESYTERSPSKSGYHVIVEGTVPSGGNRNGQLELYDRDRYFTVTGDHVPGTPQTIEERDDALTGLHREYITDRGPDEAATPDRDRTAIPSTDKALLKKARNAANGDKFDRLWNGDTSGYPSHSEADQALCNILAFWTGGDEDRIERLFEKSGLVRDKWREREDYRKRTIRNAVRDCSTFYETSQEE